MAAGYYSWVCFIDVHRGGWAGPIQQDEIEDYEEGFALDDNIKSWTQFQYYQDRPLDSLTCDFGSELSSKRLLTRRRVMKISYADCAKAESPPSELLHKRSRNRAESEAGSREIIVSAEHPWQNTNIHVSERTLVTIWQPNPNETWVTHPDKGRSNAEGWGMAQGNYIMKRAHEGALIAMISNSDWNTRAEIGTRGTIQATHDGVLYLSPNDELFPDGNGRNGFRDNSGTLRVLVRLG
jgi:hypothetical protein